MLSNQKGLTLIEMATVIAIIGILAAVLTPAVTDVIKESKISAAEEDIGALVTGLLRFHADTGVWPADDDSAPTDGKSDPDLMGSSCAEGVVGSSGIQGMALLCKGDVGTQKVALPQAVQTTVTAADGVAMKWRGPYITKEIKTNPFGGSYVLDNNSDLITVPNQSTATKDVLLLVTKLPLDVMTRIDADLDDGNLTKGFIRRSGSTSTLQVVVAAY